MALTRARTVMRMFSRVARRHSGSCILRVAIITRHESNTVAMRRLTLVTSMIFTIGLLGLISDVLALEEILEIFKGI